MVPPAPKNINEICSFNSIRFASGYIECRAACQAGGCCSSDPSSSDSSNTSKDSSGISHLAETPKSCLSTHIDVCAEYEPCDALERLQDIHGTPIDLVNSKCTKALMMTSLGIDDCENACQSRSCCFADSKKRNCYDDNKVCTIHMIEECFCHIMTH